MNWLLIFLGFSLLIVLHEAGHFFAAKATGMRVERFFLFFPPKLISVKRGETEYGIGAIPLGGFVKISGMNPDEELPPEAKGRGYYDQPVWKRIVVIGAGPAVNIVLAFVILFAVYLTVHPTTDRVGEIDGGSPAAAALARGDRIVSVDGKRLAGTDTAEQIERFAKQISTHKCAGKQTDGCLAATPATVRIERDGAVRTISVRPEYDGTYGRMRLGFAFGQTESPLTPGEAVDRSADFMWLVTHKTVTVIANIVDSEQRKEVSGIVGSSVVANETIDAFGAREALVLLAVVSLSLGLINLFPFLPLDGGHIFWSLVEKARRKPVPFSVMERASVVGFVLVMMLFLIGFTNDIGRLTGEGFNVR
jgi:regulator of sigma E protease